MLVDVVCHIRPSLVNGIIHESTENTDGDDIPDYDNLGDDDDDEDDDEIQYSDRFGMWHSYLQSRECWRYC